MTTKTTLNSSQPWHWNAVLSAAQFKLITEALAEGHVDTDKISTYLAAVYYPVSPESIVPIADEQQKAWIRKARSHGVNATVLPHFQWGMLIAALEGADELRDSAREELRNLALPGWLAEGEQRETDLAAAQRRFSDVIAATMDPLLDRQDAGDEQAADTLRQLGAYLLDSGCALVNMGDLPLEGLDIAVVAAQDRADRMSAQATEDPGANTSGTVCRCGEAEPRLIDGIRDCAERLATASMKLYDLAYNLRKHAESPAPTGGEDGAR